ncbi:MAG: lactate utilization protein [Clostridiales bacterium]|jgi:hypothetical protein|nr:lactate utilization protein [Clostridiales bacterium]
MGNIENAAQNLEAHGFKTQIFETAEEAKAAALKLIGKGSVGIGGSITISDMGLYETLLEQGNAVYWHWKVAPEERADVFPLAGSADTYLCSSNAILESGALLNIDGNGNRVSAMYIGPRQLIVVAGENKIRPDYEQALARIKKTACPLNARRLNLQTPCNATGVCNDCNSPQRMCGITVLLERPGIVKNAHVFLVRQSLGY